MGSMTQPESGNPLTDWFRSVQREIADDYDRLHQEALNDPQLAGHGAEATWKDVLARWLPDGYGVEARKYIVPEVGMESFEMDLVVLRPSYPKPLHHRAKILAGGVAAVFSVKQTLDADGIVDGVDRAMRLRRAMKPRSGTPREQMLAPFPVGLLAHSHSRTSPGSTPERNVYGRLCDLAEETRHPREGLDYLCVADLGFWATSRVPYSPPGSPLARTDEQRTEGLALTSVMALARGDYSVGAFITSLIARLSYGDPTLRPLADNFVAMEAVGGGGGMARAWDLGAVYDDRVRQNLPLWLAQEGYKFGTTYA
jgi:hypothetical protein